jgi:hypothetical protein
VREALLLALTRLHLDGLNAALAQAKQHWPVMPRLTGGHKRCELGIGKAILLELTQESNEGERTETHGTEALTRKDSISAGGPEERRAEKKRGDSPKMLLGAPTHAL